MVPNGFTATSSISDTVVHLGSGDSVEVHSAGPVLVQNRGTGLRVHYYPFLKSWDTTAVRRVALELFHALEPQIYGSPPFVGLVAVDRPAAQRRGAYTMRTFGVMFERAPDGGWSSSGRPVELGAGSSPPSSSR